MTPADYSTGRIVRRDPVLATSIRAHGRCGLADALRAAQFSALAWAIVFQQLSTKPASTVHGRLTALLPEGKVTAPAIAARAEDQFRSVGVSRQDAPAGKRTR